MKISLFYLLLCILLAKNLNSQQYVPVTFVKGNYFYNHTVIDGNTLFYLQKLYSCPAEDILNANEGIERGLDISKIVLIPVSPKTITHIVKEKESLSYLSRLYFVPIDSIIKYNLNSEKELKIGQELSIKGAIIPILKEYPTNSEKILNDVSSLKDTPIIKSNLKDNDIYVFHTVQNQETLYTISKRFMVSSTELQDINKLKSSRISTGDVLKIKLKNENKENVGFRSVESKIKIEPASFSSLKNSESISIALFLPFNVDSQTSINKNISNAAIEYYMGVKLAIDSLTNLGLKAEFFIYDYFDKTKSLESILEQKSFLSIDLIIAPLHQKEAEIVALWAKKKNIRMIYSVSFS